MHEQFDENGLYDIYSIWHVPFWKTQTFLLIVGIISTVIIFTIVWFLFKKFKRIKKIERSAWDIALTSLKKLQDQTYTTKEEGKQVYFEITEILKRYIQSRYALDVHSRTDEELINFLHEQDLPIIVKTTIKKIGEGSLLIKFANQQAMQTQIDHDITLSIDMIRATIPSK